MKDPLQKALEALDSGDKAAVKDAEHALEALLQAPTAVKKDGRSALSVRATGVIYWSASRSRVENGDAWLDLLIRLLQDTPEYRAMADARSQLSRAQGNAEVVFRAIVAANPHTAPEETRREHAAMLGVVNDKAGELRRAEDALGAAAKRLVKSGTNP